MVSIPWKRIEAGTLAVTIENLPDNLPLQRPQKYSKEQLASIIAVKESLKITSVKVIRYGIINYKIIAKISRLSRENRPVQG